MEIARGLAHDKFAQVEAGFFGERLQALVLQSLNRLGRYFQAHKAALLFVPNPLPLEIDHLKPLVAPVGEGDAVGVICLLASQHAFAGHLAHLIEDTSGHSGTNGYRGAKATGLAEEEQFRHTESGTRWMGSHVW